jgi:hypothetical protein
MSFFGSIFGGSNPTLNAGINQAGQVAGYGTGMGENLTTSAGNFFQTLLSGDTSKQMQLLAPQTRAQQQAAQQQKKTMGTFGNRSGGTNAAAQSIDDKTRANINDMIATLTGQAATQAGTMGQNLIDTGLNALNMKVGFSQQQMQNWNNSILGQGISTGAGYAEGAALAA